MNIVYCFDKKYQDFTLNSINSLIDNMEEGDIINLYLIITSDVDKTLFNFDNITINFIEYNPNDNLYISGHVSQMCYTKLYIADLIPNIQKCIYLDGDTLIKGSLKDLWNINMDNYSYCAKKYISPKWDDHLFNSGVLLINLDKIRKEKMIEKYNKYISENEVIKQHDETILNLLHTNDILEISNIWNNFHSKKQWVYHCLSEIKKTRLLSKRGGEHINCNRDQSEYDFERVNGEIAATVMIYMWNVMAVMTTHVKNSDGSYDSHPSMIVFDLADNLKNVTDDYTNGVEGDIGYAFFDNGVCELCGLECEHEYSYGNTCFICGMKIDQNTSPTNACFICGKEFDQNTSSTNTIDNNRHQLMKLKKENEYLRYLLRRLKLENEDLEWKLLNN